MALNLCNVPGCGWGRLVPSSTQDQGHLEECCLWGWGVIFWSRYTDLMELVAKLHLHSIRTLPQSTHQRIALPEGIMNWLEV